VAKHLFCFWAKRPQRLGRAGEMRRPIDLDFETEEVPWVDQKLDFYSPVKHMKGLGQFRGIEQHLFDLVKCLYFQHLKVSTFNDVLIFQSIF
jgi:hypothetical protein